MNSRLQTLFKNRTGPAGAFLPLLVLGTLCLIASCSLDDLFHRPYVATVNGEKIFFEDYQKRLNAQKGVLSPKAFTDSHNKQRMLEEEILESMIIEKIILQRAQEMNLSVSTTELERKLIDIRKDYGENFFDLLVQQNVQYDEWREELRKEMLFDKLVAADVNATIQVSEDEAEDHFNSHPGLCRSEARVRASQIVVRDMEKAKEIKSRLENGEDFTKVAAEVSIGPEAARGGDLGLVSRQTMPEPLDKTLFNLGIGQMSPIVKSAYGYHIFKVTEIRPARTRSFAECRQDVIADVRALKEDAAFAVWLEGLKAKAVVKKEMHVLRQKRSK